MFLPGLPFGADGNTLDEAVETLVEILREYAVDWTTESYLREAPNHRDNWALVQIIALSTDAQLRDWIVGEAAALACLNEQSPLDLGGDSRDGPAVDR